MQAHPAHTVFDSAIDDWYRQNVDAAIKKLQDQSPDVQFKFRPDQVVDGSKAGDQQIAASDEQLVRWDTRDPALIFEKGFPPRTAYNDTTLNMYNFKRYQQLESVASVFVATARYFQSSEGVTDVWKPLTWEKGTIYKYTVSGCYGGIDVIATLGQKNKYLKEHEITFVGGIKKDFVRFAIKYEDGVATKIFDNGHTTQVASTIPRPANIPVETIKPK